MAQAFYRHPNRGPLKSPLPMLYTSGVTLSSISIISPRLRTKRQARIIQQQNNFQENSAKRISNDCFNVCFLIEQLITRYR